MRLLRTLSIGILASSCLACSKPTTKDLPPAAATSPQPTVVAPAIASSQPLLTLVTIQPRPAQPVDPHTVLTARLTYSTGDAPAAECFISAQFDLLRSGMTTATVDVDSPAYPTLATSTGETHVTQDLWQAAEDRQISRPFRVRFYLHRRLGKGQSIVLAETPVLTYSLKD